MGRTHRLGLAERMLGEMDAAAAVGPGDDVGRQQAKLAAARRNLEMLEVGSTKTTIAVQEASVKEAVAKQVEIDHRIPDRSFQDHKDDHKDRAAGQQGQDGRAAARHADAELRRCGCAIECAQRARARVAVLPFTINAEKDLSFLKQGIIDMLSSRLSWETSRPSRK